MFEPSSVEANTTVTVTLALEGVGDELVVPVPDAFTVFGCSAPAGWTCTATPLGALPASITVRRDGADVDAVEVRLELRTPTAGGDYAFGNDVLVVTGGFEGGPDLDGDAGDEPVVGQAQPPAASGPAVDGDEGAAVPSIVAAALLLVVAVAAYRAARRQS